MISSTIAPSSFVLNVCFSRLQGSKAMSIQWTKFQITATSGNNSAKLKARNSSEAKDYADYEIEFNHKKKINWQNLHMLYFCTLESNTCGI